MAQLQWEMVLEITHNGLQQKKKSFYFFFFLNAEGSGAPALCLREVTLETQKGCCGHGGGVRAWLGLPAPNSLPTFLVGKLHRHMPSFKFLKCSQ